MLHEGSIAVMDKIEGDFSPYKTGSPVLDASSLMAHGDGLDGGMMESYGTSSGYFRSATASECPS